MSSRNVVKVLLLVALLGLSLVPLSQARPGRGRKRAFGVGILGGALAGVAVGNMMAKSNQAPVAAPAAAPAASVAHVHHFYPGGVPVNPAPPPPAPAPAPIAVAVPVQPEPQKTTVVETGAPDANGCYKQTIRQPNPNNPKTYTETENLICPTLQQANQPAPQISPRADQVPVMPQPLPVFQVPGSGPPAPAAAHPAAPPAPAAAPAPGAAPVPAPASAPVHPPAGFIVPAGPVHPVAPAAPVAVPAPAPIPSVPAVQPNAIPQPAQGQPQHVIVQSTHTIKKYPKSRRSSAPSLYIPQGVLAMLVLFYSVKSLLF